MSHRWIALLLVTLAAGCADEEAGPVDAGVEATAVPTIAKDVQADHCQVTSLTCAAATFTCSGMPPGGDVSDHWNHHHRIAADGTATYTIAHPWNGRYASVICPRSEVDPMDASVPGCVLDIDTITLPDACRTRTFTGVNGVSIPSNEPLGATSTLGMNEQVVRNRALIDVDILHPTRGDLTVAVVEPNGRRTPLHTRTGGTGDHLRQRYLIPISSPPTGGWILHAIDGPLAGTGTLRTFSVRRASSCGSWLPCFAGLDEYCTTSDMSRPGLAIPDGNGALTQTFEVGAAGITGEVELQIWGNHARSSDLEIDLTAPGGRTTRVWNREGGNAPFESLWVQLGHFADTARAGTWTLTIRDRRGQNTGTLRSWQLTTEPLCR